MLALLTWTSVAASEANGVVDIASLGGAFPMLYGNVVAILSSGFHLYSNQFGSEQEV